MTISLRPLADADLDDVHRWESDPDATAMAAFTREDPTDRAAFDAHYRRVRADPTNLLLVIEDDGRLVGTISSFTIDGEREVSYWIDPERWGRGIASAALRLFLDRELERPLHARTAAHNLASAAVLRRAGFVRIGTETSWAPGVGRDVVEHIHRLD
ncbi:GNAT family N-acetyltransferase [Agrococcus sp. DT81.2]|uniref:GNAT family N-acetyltransferase n=1 Tax=Agrococcus sp. DT81.2 TaxID=3393414 RepID=UPI003CE4BBE1